MMQVNHEDVPVSERAVAVRMAVGFRPFPTLMLVLVMFVMHMKMLVLHRAVPVFQFRRIVGRP